MTTENHQFFSFHIICAWDKNWYSCEHQNCLQYTEAGCQLSTSLCHLLVHPDHAAPGVMTQMKTLQFFCPRPGYQQAGKRSSQKKKQHRSQLTNHGWHQTQGLCLKKSLFHLNSHTKQVNDMSNKLIILYFLYN